MVFLSNDPLTKPFSASVAYLTVLQEIVELGERHTVGGQRSRASGRMKHSNGSQKNNA